MRFTLPRRVYQSEIGRWLAFLFLDPLGVGKTELCKKGPWPPRCFDSDDAMCAHDMSEYMEKHAVKPPDRTPLPASGLRRGCQAHRSRAPPPYAVILFDEVEKGIPCVLTYCSRCSIDGRVTDGQGRTVAFHQHGADPHQQTSAVASDSGSAGDPARHGRWKSE